MYKAKDGKAFGNSEMGKHYDSTRPEKHSAPAGKANEGRQGSGTPDSESHADENAIGGIVEEHGPADKTMIEKDGDSGEYTVHSHHGGHHHASKGHDVHSAHAHSMKAMGEAGGQYQEPDGDEAMAAPAIPGMAG